MLMLADAVAAAGSVGPAVGAWDWSYILTGPGIAALLTLALLEVVLGIDNIVVISVVVARLPAERQRLARNVGLALAMILRIVLLLAIGWIISLDQTVLFAFEREWVNISITGKDVVLIAGGLFLIWKATTEIHHKLEGHAPTTPQGRAAGSFGKALVQILAMDAVFSIDSVVTAVGMSKNIPVMIVAVVAAVLVMMLFAGPVGRFVERHVSIKVLALSFLIMIGVLLVADGLGTHLSRGYVYFAMAFSLVVELINLRVRSKHAPGGTHA